MVVRKLRRRVMHTSTASREVTGGRAVFAGAVVAVVCGAGVAVIVTVSGVSVGVADVKTSVGTTVDLEESFSGLRVYDVLAPDDPFGICGSLSQTSRVLYEPDPPRCALSTGSLVAYTV